MRKPTSEPLRLLELPSQDDPSNAARLVRSALMAPAEPVPRLKGRIRHTLRRKSVWRHRYLRAALAGGFIFLTGGVVGAVVHPILQVWQQRKVESVQAVHPASDAPRSRQRRGHEPPPRLTDEGLLTPDQPGNGTSLPTGLAPALAPTPRQQSAEPSGLSALPSEPPAARAMPAPGIPEPAPARAPVLPTGSPRTPSDPTARLAPARHSTHGALLRTTMLEPPSRRPEPWLTTPPATPPLPPAAPAASVSAAPFASPPSPPPPQAQVAPLPITSGGSGPRSASASIAPMPTSPSSPSEQALLSRALRSLRSEHRPESALAVLDEYAAWFPNGNLLPEATRLRTEALLALGRNRAALAELNREPDPGATGGGESRLVRGELRAAAGRWQEALEDFDAVVRARLAHEPTDSPSSSAKPRERFERALWGRASARSHLGDDAGARADLRECLRRFPQGRFAAQAARLLGEPR